MGPCRQEENADLRQWEPHVLSNLPFYTVLFPLFLDLLRTRVSSRGDAALTDLVKVRYSFAEILFWMEDIERVYASCFAYRIGSGSTERLSKLPISLRITTCRHKSILFTAEGLDTMRNLYWLVLGLQLLHEIRVACESVGPIIQQVYAAFSEGNPA